MDINVISEMISSLGFPIVACAGLFWFLNKQEERRSAEIDEINKALTENSAVLESLKDLIQVLVAREKQE